MISLDRLLDGLDVEVETLPADAGPAPGPRGCAGVLELVSGSFVKLSPRSLPVVMAAAQPPLKHGPPAAIGVRVTYQRAVGLFDHLREPLVEPVAEDDPIHRALRELLDELAAQRPGHRAMTEILGRRCLILLLRRAFARGACPIAWMASLEDARVGRAVAAMRDHPQHAFTLPELADLAGMSRSAFAARFAGTLDQSPIGFLKTLRLARAAELLTRTDLPVKAVATQVGYASRSSFTRAFDARYGAAPAAFRLRARAAADGERATLGTADVA